MRLWGLTPANGERTQVPTHTPTPTPAKCISCLSGGMHAWVHMHMCVTSWSRVQSTLRYSSWNDGLFLWDPEFISRKDTCSACAPQGPDLLLPVLVDFLVLFWLANIPWSLWSLEGKMSQLLLHCSVLTWFWLHSFSRKGTAEHSVHGAEEVHVYVPTDRK